MNKCTEKLSALQVDFSAIQDKFKDENGVLEKLEPISAIMRTLTSQIQDIMNENEDKMKRVNSNSQVWTNVKDCSSRISEICDDLMNCNLERKENSESRFAKQHRALLQLLQKIYNEETVFTSKLVCLQRVCIFEFYFLRVTSNLYSSPPFHHSSLEDHWRITSHKERTPFYFLR